MQTFKQIYQRLSKTLEASTKHVTTLSDSQLPLKSNNSSKKLSKNLNETQENPKIEICVSQPPLELNNSSKKPLENLNEAQEDKKIEINDSQLPLELNNSSKKLLENLSEKKKNRRIKICDSQPPLEFNNSSKKPLENLNETQKNPRIKICDSQPPLELNNSSKRPFENFNEAQKNREIEINDSQLPLEFNNSLKTPLEILSKTQKNRRITICNSQPPQILNAPQKNQTKETFNSQPPPNPTNSPKKPPHALNKSQKDLRKEICLSLLKRHSIKPFLNRLITCDEKWLLYGKRPQPRNHPLNQIPKPLTEPTKIMMTVWWSMAGIIHYSFLKTGLSINSQSYCHQLDTVNEKLRDKGWIKNRGRPILLHDNARPHVSSLTMEKLRELKFEVLPHPPYSPDLSPTDYYFFRYLDDFLRGRRGVGDREGVVEGFEEFAKGRGEEFYCFGIESLVERWQRCLDSRGEYFD